MSNRERDPDANHGPSVCSNSSKDQTHDERRATGLAMGMDGGGRSNNMALCNKGRTWLQHVGIDVCIFFSF